MRIKTNDIFIGRRARKLENYGQTEMAELSKSLEENGQITPITVRPVNDQDKAEPDYEEQPWALVAGGRRLAASLLLGWEEIEGYAREELSELTHKLLELHENIVRKDMTWQEQVDAKAELVRLRRLENPDITDREIANEIGETAANLSRDLKTAHLLEEHPDLRRSSSKGQALNTGTILREHNKRIATLAGISSTTLEDIQKNIFSEDAEDFILNVEDKSIDLCLIDGPYGINYWDVREVSTHTSDDSLAEYDDRPSVIFPLYERLLPELVRTTRETGWIFFFCSTQLERKLREYAERCCRVHAEYFSSDPDDPEFYTARCSKWSPESPCVALAPEELPWIWHKPNATKGSRFPHLHASNKYELILPINMGKGRLMYSCSNVLNYDVNYGKDDRIHGVQRPIELLQEIIKRTTYSGDKVLDCFYGSGSALAAAASLGRRFIGSDKNPALRQFAIGLVTKHFKHVSQTEIQASNDRYIRQLSGESVLPPIKAERSGDSKYDYEVFRIGSDYLGYIRYDGHNMAQRRMVAGDQDAFEFELGEICGFLDELNETGILDACCCTPEECQDAVNRWIEAKTETQGVD